MTDESALKLAEAMNRLAASIERVSGHGLSGGIQVYHSGFPSQAQTPLYAGREMFGTFTQ